MEGMFENLNPYELLPDLFGHFGRNLLLLRFHELLLKLKYVFNKYINVYMISRFCHFFLSKVEFFLKTKRLRL